MFDTPEVLKVLIKLKIYSEGILKLLFIVKSVGTY